MNSMVRLATISSLVLALNFGAVGQGTSGKLVAPKPDKHEKLDKQEKSEKAESPESKKLRAPAKKREPKREISGSIPEEPYAPMPVPGMPISRTMLENGSGITSSGGFLYVLNGSVVYKVRASDLTVVQTRDLRLSSNSALIQSGNSKEPDELLAPQKKSKKKKSTD